jgi:hypothetical protein
MEIDAAGVAKDLSMIANIGWGMPRYGELHYRRTRDE